MNLINYLNTLNTSHIRIPRNWMWILQKKNIFFWFNLFVYNNNKFYRFLWLLRLFFPVFGVNGTTNYPGGFHHTGHGSYSQRPTEISQRFILVFFACVCLPGGRKLCYFFRFSCIRMYRKPFLVWVWERRYSIKSLAM